MTASRKKTTPGLQLDEIFLESAQERAGFWSDEATGNRPLSSHRDIQDFDAVQSRPANDHGRRPRAELRPVTAFVGSRHFWWALGASIVFCLLFALLMGFGSATARAELFATPAQHASFWASLAAIAAIQWIFALSSHRQSVNEDMLHRVILATQRFREPNAMADDAGRRINASFAQLFDGIDARMALLDERSAQFAEQVAASMQHANEVSDVNTNTMRGIVAAGETQREALQRTGMMISNEVLPVIAKLETTVTSLGTVSQNAGVLLDTIGGKLQQTTRDLKTCLDAFTSANHNVVPDLEKRMQKFEASIAQLPEQLDATIGRLGPMSDTIADAALLSTANIEVIDQLSKDITAVLDNSRASFAELSANGAQLLQIAVDAHAGRFREMLEATVSEQASRVSGLSRELGQLADHASAAVDRLQQPVGEMTVATERAFVKVNESLDGLDKRVAANLTACVAELNDTAARLVSSVNREIETSALGLQTRLAASATELMQRVHADTARFEGLIGETAERSSGRLASVINDLPTVLAQRMDTEIAKIDSNLKASLFGLSDHIRQIVDAVPGRLAAVTRETLQTLEFGIDRSFEDVTQRSQLLNDQFRKSATETTEAVLQGYVDFIFLAAERFRTELQEVNGAFTRKLEAQLHPLPQDDTASPAAPDETPGH